MNIWEAIDRAHNNLQLLEDLIIKNPITDLDQIKDGLTAIMWASKLGHAGIVKSLFDLGANVNQRNNHGITPLMLAAENNHKKVLKLLIEDGAKINLKNNKGQDALAFARETGNADIEKLLIEYEAKDNLKVKKQKDIHAVTHTVTQTSVLKETHKPIENAKLKSKKENGEQKHIEKLEPKHVPKHTVALKNK
ncbi:MAG: ankyrin repeat domain-containing protein, partial [Gammaproteobacteria bacterium]|nr:ankyrin repeat domain-containing protein [Gammaproteobacteria bacterium]